MKTLKEFYGRIEQVRDVRVALVQSYLDTGKVAAELLDELGGRILVFYNQNTHRSLMLFTEHLGVTVR